MTMAVTALTLDEFKQFREYFYKKTGIEFDDSKRYFVDKRILRRIEATGARSFREYFVHMRFEASQSEFQELVNQMTVNETYFFREDHQFRVLVSDVMDEVVHNRRRRKGPTRLLSLPCSTGEEPYSIALHLIEEWPGLAQHDVELSGCDIDTVALGKCEDGVFGERSVQHVPPAMLKRHFTPLAGRRYRISDQIRDAVRFFPLNLSDPQQTRALKGYDVIFCRNMLIYFDDQSRRRAADTLFDALNPGGFLFLGHSESMSRMSSLYTVRKFTDAIVYQRPLS